MPRFGSKNGHFLADGTPESSMMHPNVLRDDPPSRNVADLLQEGRSTVGKVLNQSGDSSKDFDKIGEDDPRLDSTSKLGEGLKSPDAGHLYSDEDKVKNAKPPLPRRKTSASSTPKSVRVDPSSVGANPGTTLGLPAAIGGATSAVPLATGWYLGDAIRAGAQYPLIEGAAKYIPGGATLLEIIANGVRHVRNSRAALGGLGDKQRANNDRGLQEAKKGHSASPKAVAEINQHLGTILRVAPDLVTAPMSIAARQARILAVVKNMSPEAAGKLAISLNGHASSQAMWGRLKSAGVAALGTGAAMTVAGLGIPAGISTAVTGFLTAAAAAGIVKLWHCACQKCFTPHMRLAVDQTEDGESEVRFESREEVNKRRKQRIEAAYKDSKSTGSAVVSKIGMIPKVAKGVIATLGIGAVATSAVYGMLQGLGWANAIASFFGSEIGIGTILLAGGAGALVGGGSTLAVVGSIWWLLKKASLIGDGAKLVGELFGGNKKEEKNSGLDTKQLAQMPKAMKEASKKEDEKHE